MSKNARFVRSQKAPPSKQGIADNYPFDIHNFVIAGVLILLLFILYPQFSRNRKKAVLSDLTVKSRPIISALEAYRVQKGEYPQNLDTLVPDFLEEIPEVKKSIGSYAYSKIVDTRYELKIKFADGFKKYCYMIYIPYETYRLPYPYYEEERIDDWVIAGFRPE